jgi:ParB-like chromosome segregation protein Spo0J
LIKDQRFEKLKKSIQDDPEMLQLRELLVYPYNDKFVVIGGNMRLKAMKELGYKEAPCKVIDASTPSEKLRAYTIKDNVGYGEHDIDLLANDWDVEELKDWGVEDIDFSYMDINQEDLDKFFEENDSIPEEEKQKIVLEYTQEQYPKVVEAFKNHSNKSKEQVVWELLEI